LIRHLIVVLEKIKGHFNFWRGENLARSTSTIGNLGGETFIGSI
jgi:hypothetical protein